MPGTCTIACKLPHGLYMQLFVTEDASEPVMGGGSRAIKVSRPAGERVRLNGWARDRMKESETQIVGGYALTHNIDADFAEKWFSDNASLDIVKNKIVFMQPKHTFAESQAREQLAIKSGFEPIDPANLPREFKKVETAVSASA